MQKTICGKVYDTETAALIKQVTCGAFGEDDGYEEALYQTEAGFFFLYVNGGATSIHPQEEIKRLSKDKADKWLDENK